jgi:CheY-like chemotaxis protein
MSSLIRIVLCDDDSDEQLFFETALCSMNQPYTLQWLSNGAQLLEYLSHPAQIPNLIFLDINMPGISGLDCLRIIREQPRFKDLPVIMHSLTTGPQDIYTAYKAGASLFIEKAVSMTTDLKTLLAKVIQLYNTTSLHPGKADFFQFSGIDARPMGYCS